MKKKLKSPHFSPLLPTDKTWFNTKDVASMLGRTDQYVRDCYDSGRLPGHRLAAGPVSERTRHVYQFHRDALLMYLLETANYTPEDFEERLAALIRGRSPEEMRTVLARAGMVILPTPPP
ncbi:hypothetical protein, partial [Cerasicoccus arenae]